MASTSSDSRPSTDDTLHGPPDTPVDENTANTASDHDSLRPPSSSESGAGPLGIQSHHPQEFYNRRRSSVRISQSRRQSSISLQRVKSLGGRKWWKFHFRDWDDDMEEDWWFASTAIPLLAATIGPLANVLSIAALVSSWRMCLVEGVGKDGARECLWDGVQALGPQLEGQPFTDPEWCLKLNIVSLIVGFIGNFFLLCNFTNRIRYIIALPVTIVCWYIATGILTGITVAMQVYVPPIGPQQNYSQGFWYAVIAACMYMACAMLLMVNMLGYFLGHYPQHFALTESQRTLILQTMLFFIWLAGGGALFSKIEQRYGDGTFKWSYADGLYFCDVTILTVGFGDVYPVSDIGRGLVFPYSVGGIIMLGLMVSSITTFAREIGSENVVRRHIERTRHQTMTRTVRTSTELERRQTMISGERARVSEPWNAQNKPFQRTIAFTDDTEDPKKTSPLRRTGTMEAIKKAGGSLLSLPQRTVSRKPKLLLLREEKDRFDAMRKIQAETSHFKNWYALCLSVIAFGILWCVGAVVFWQAEKDTQGMTYFQALYFCYVSLLTIGYGDLSPKSNAGRPFFVFWSLIAVPTMTILVSDLGETVINKFKNGTSGLADFTVLPQKGVWRNILLKYPWILDWLQQRKARKDTRKREEEGLPMGPEDEATPSHLDPKTIDELAKEELSDFDLALQLATGIKQAAQDVKDRHHKKYSYEEWVEFTQLIRFTSAKGRKEEEAEEGLVHWDWIGEDSPMMANKSEAEFVLDRLCESLVRYVKRRETSVKEDGDAEGDGLVMRFEKRKKKKAESEDMSESGTEETQMERRSISHSLSAPDDGEDVGPFDEKRSG